MVSIRFKCQLSLGIGGYPGDGQGGAFGLGLVDLGSLEVFKGGSYGLESMPESQASNHLLFSIGRVIREATW